MRVACLPKAGTSFEEGKGAAPGVGACAYWGASNGRIGS